jgi:hypothetical protein
MADNRDHSVRGQEVFIPRPLQGSDHLRGSDDLESWDRGSPDRLKQGVRLWGGHDEEALGRATGPSRGGRNRWPGEGTGGADQDGHERRSGPGQEKRPARTPPPGRARHLEEDPRAKCRVRRGTIPLPKGPGKKGVLPEGVPTPFPEGSPRASFTHVLGPPG